HHRPFEEVPSLDLRAELLGLVEVVVDPVLFPATWLAARRGDVHHSVFQFFHEPVDHRVLPAAGRRGDDHEQTATVDAQRSSSSSGVAVTGVPSDARWAARSGASGAVKVRSPPCGRRTVRRHAWRNCRPRPLASPRFPYTGSPTIGSRAYARCTRIWCVRPVTGRT